MGHESPIELWSPNLTTFCFVGFGTNRLRREEAMKTAGKENPNRCAITRQPTELLGRKLELSLLNQAGWKARKHPARAKYFFLTFPFIELHVQVTAAKWGEDNFRITDDPRIHLIQHYECHRIYQQQPRPDTITLRRNF